MMGLVRKIRSAAARWPFRADCRASTIGLDESASPKLKIFCISMQRTGTTSVGQFFRDHGLRSAGWGEDMQNSWSNSWYEGNFERIFSSPDFLNAQGYEDSPWFLPEFYKVLYHRFPGSKFILFTRDPRKWFESMLSHSDGTVLGACRGHAKIYRRENEYFRLLDAGKFEGQPALPKLADLRPEDRGKMTLHGLEEHYVSLYNLHNREVIDFFERNSPTSLLTARLEDPEKWLRLGKFLNIGVNPQYNTHLNQSRITVAAPVD